MAAALRMTQRRVEQREALRRAEEERRAWEAEQAAAQAQMDLAEPVPEAPAGPVAATVAPEPEPAPTEAQSAPEAAPQGRETVYYFEVAVPEGIKPQFVDVMKRLGTHGRLLRKE